MFLFVPRSREHKKKSIFFVNSPVLNLANPRDSVWGPRLPPTLSSGALHERGEQEATFRASVEQEKVKRFGLACGDTHEERFVHPLRTEPLERVIPQVAVFEDGQAGEAAQEGDGDIDGGPDIVRQQDHTSRPSRPGRDFRNG